MMPPSREHNKNGCSLWKLHQIFQKDFAYFALLYFVLAYRPVPPSIGPGTCAWLQIESAVHPFRSIREKVRHQSLW